jgi:hypothetical protein
MQIQQPKGQLQSEREWRRVQNTKHGSLRNNNDHSRDSVVGIGTGWTTEGLELKTLKGQEFTVLYVVQTGSGVHPASYAMGTAGSSTVIKRPRREADYSPPASAEVKNMWIYTSTPPDAFMA